MIKTRIRISAENKEMSTALIRCVQPDNAQMKGLLVKSRATDNNAFLTISYVGRVETFISTLDDLLRCIQAASATLGRVRNRIS